MRFPVIIILSLLIGFSFSQAREDCSDENTKTLVSIDEEAASKEDLLKIMRLFGVIGFEEDILSSGTSFFLSFDSRKAPIESLNKHYSELESIDSVTIKVFCDTPDGLLPLTLPSSP